MPQRRALCQLLFANLVVVHMISEWANANERLLECWRPLLPVACYAIASRLGHIQPYNNVTTVTQLSALAALLQSYYSLKIFVLLQTPDGSTDGVWRRQMISEWTNANERLLECWRPLLPVACYAIASRRPVDDLKHVAGARQRQRQHCPSHCHRYRIGTGLWRSEAIKLFIEPSLVKPISHHGSSWFKSILVDSDSSLIISRPLDIIVADIADGLLAIRGHRDVYRAITGQTNSQWNRYRFHGRLCVGSPLFADRQSSPIVRLEEWPSREAKSLVANTRSFSRVKAQCEWAADLAVPTHCHMPYHAVPCRAMPCRAGR
ncbi:hypothetical protein J6590_059184 [Homalodisca vitripennis]|nr:hypothetical protein J6590_059184 [Homalodisca vitripennis]